MPVLLKAILCGIAWFLVSTWMVRDSVWQMAFQMSTRYPNIDCRAISDQVKDRTYSRGWLISSIIGSLLVAVGFYFWDSYAGLDVSLSGAFLSGGYICWHGIRNFRLAVKEIGVPWPPHPRDRKWP